MRDLHHQGEPGISIALSQGCTYRDGVRVQLTPRENDVLSAVALHRRPISTDALLERVWPNEDPAQTRLSLKVHVHRIRRRLGSKDILVNKERLWSIGGGATVDLDRWRRLARLSEGDLDAAARAALVDAYKTLTGPAPGIFSRSALLVCVENAMREVLFDVATTLAQDAYERRAYRSLLSITRAMVRLDETTPMWDELSERANTLYFRQHG